MGQSLCCNNDSQAISDRSPTEESHINIHELPHKCSEILKGDDIEIAKYCKDKLYDKLHNGIVLNDKIKYWVDRVTGKNCFMLFARNLEISGDKDYHKWSWQRSILQDDVIAEIAIMEEALSLSVSGRFPTEWLSPGTMYKVAFVLRFRKSKPVTGWNIPVRTVLLLPVRDKILNETIKPIEGKVMLADAIGHGKQSEVVAGEFIMDPQLYHGDMQFFLRDIDSSEKKTSLIIKAVKITPVS